MNAYDSETETGTVATLRDNVVAFPGRPQKAPPRFGHDPADINMERFPVDIRGQVTFGRLMKGLATVGLTVRVDTRSGRVVITDDEWE
jgi:hypothetical protein